MKKQLKRLLLGALALVMLLTSVGFPNAEAATPTKMIHIERKADQNPAVLAQNIALTKDTTYTVSFQAKHNGSNILFVVKGPGNPTSNKNFAKKLSEDFTVDAKTDTYSYTFTWTGDSANYAVGFQFEKESAVVSMDLAGMTMTAAGSTENLYTENTLSGWRSDWTNSATAFEGIDKATTFLDAKTVEKATYVATLKDYDETLFGVPPTPMMLHVERKTWENPAVLAQNIELTKDTSYTFSFQAKHNGSNIWFVIKGPGNPTSNKGFEKKITGTDFTVDEATSTYTCSFTWTGDSGKYAVGLEFRSNSEPVTMELAKMKLVAAGSTKNMMKENAIDCWRSDWTSSATAFEGIDKATTFLDAKTEEKATYVATLVPYDASVFEKAPDPMMFHIERKLWQNPAPFVQKPTLTEGKEYTISLQAKHNGTNVWLVVKNANTGGSPHIEQNLNSSNSDLVYDMATSSYSYTFTWGKATGQYSVGIEFRTNSQAPVTLDLANVKLTEAGSDVNLFSEYTFNGWHSEWTHGAAGTTTFMDAGSEPKATYVATLVPYDATVFQTGLKVTEGSLVLEDEVLYNFYYDLAAPNGTFVESVGLVTFPSALADGTVETEGAQIIVGDATLPYVQSNPVPAKNMGDTLYFKVYAKLDTGLVLYSELKEYSARTYCQHTLADENADAALKQLCVALMNYGAKAQQYFGYKTDALMNEGITGQVDAYADTMVTPLGQVPAITGYEKTENGFIEGMATVVLGGSLSINYYFIPSEEVTGDVTLYVWSNGTDAEPEAIVMTKGEDGRYKGTVSGIAAKDINAVVHAAVKYNDHCSGVVAYSVTAACTAHMSSENADLKALAEALVVYGHYADAYFAQ